MCVYHAMIRSSFLNETIPRLHNPITREYYLFDTVYTNASCDARYRFSLHQIPILTHLNDGNRRNVSGRVARKDQTVPFHVHVRQAIGHEKDGRRISGRNRRGGMCVIGVGTVCSFTRARSSVQVPTAVVVPEFDFSEKGLGVASLVGTRISFGPVSFGNDCISSRRQDEKIGYHDR